MGWGASSFSGIERFFLGHNLLTVLRSTQECKIGCQLGKSVDFVRKSKAVGFVLRVRLKGAC